MINLCMINSVNNFYTSPSNKHTSKWDELRQNTEKFCQWYNITAHHYLLNKL